MNAESVQLVICLCALVPTVDFVVRFGRPSERWWRHRFGWSLMLLAVAVLLMLAQTILFRLYGPDYWGRDVVLISASSMVFVAMLLRDLELRSLQRQDRRRARNHTPV